MEIGGIFPPSGMHTLSIFEVWLAVLVTDILHAKLIPVFDLLGL